MPAREAPPLLGTSHFRVVIGARELGFAEVGPLSSITDEPQRHRWETIVLRRALSQSTELYDRLRVAVESLSLPERFNLLHQLGGLADGGDELVEQSLRRAAWAGVATCLRGN